MLDKANASIRSIDKNGEFLRTPLALSIWRAPTDNDRFMLNHWEEARLSEAVGEVRSFEIANNAVRFKGYMASARLIPSVYFDLVYTFGKDAVSVAIEYRCEKYVGCLPRIGFETSLDKAFDNVRYYGYGPFESYIDRRISCIKDVYENTVQEMESDYVKPQENGSHYSTEWLEISNGRRCFRVEGDFSFSALPHSTQEYTRASHNWQLPIRHATHLCIDYFMNGIGSNSCGPALDTKYYVPEQGKGVFTIIIA